VFTSLFGLRASEFSFDRGTFLVLAIVALVIRYRTALGYSGLGIYSFCLGSAVSTCWGGLVVIVVMSIVQCVEGKVTVLGFLGWLVLGLPFVAAIIAGAFRFLVFISRIILRMHVAVDRLPVGPGYKAFCFASMCMGFMFVPDSGPRTNWNEASLVGLPLREFASGLMGEAWEAFGPWFKLAVAMGVPLVCVLTLSIAGLAVVRALVPSAKGRTVLYLRAFAQRRRSTKFLRRFASRWLDQGPIHVISGPDVASHVMDASTLAAYLDDDLASAFVRDIEELRGRLAKRRTMSGWDLRYGIHEFRCHGAVWRDAFRVLLANADRAIIDLRGFSSSRAGVAFELITLLQMDQSGKSVFIVDDKTSVSDIEHLAAAASTIPPGLSAHFVENGLELVKVGGTSRSAARAALRACGGVSRLVSRRLPDGEHGAVIDPGH